MLIKSSTDFSPPHPYLYSDAKKCGNCFLSPYIFIQLRVDFASIYFYETKSTFLHSICNICVKTPSSAWRQLFRPMKSGLFDFDARPSFWIETEKDFGRNGANDGETASPRERHRTHISSKYARKAQGFEVVIKALNFEGHGLCESKSARSGTRTRTYSRTADFESAAAAITPPWPPWWSGRRESNPRSQLGRLELCH